MYHPQTQVLPELNKHQGDTTGRTHPTKETSTDTNLIDFMYKLIYILFFFHYILS